MTDLHRERDGSLKRLPPDVCRVLKRDRSLLTERGSGVAADRDRRRGIAEPSHCMELEGEAAGHRADDRVVRLLRAGLRSGHLTSDESYAHRSALSADPAIVRPHRYDWEDKGLLQSSPVATSRKHCFRARGLEIRVNGGLLRCQEHD